MIKNQTTKHVHVICNVCTKIHRINNFNGQHKKTHGGLAHPLLVGEKPLTLADELKAFLVSLGHPDPYFEGVQPPSAPEFSADFWQLDKFSNFEKCGKI